jgi:hypothetical protein
MGLVTRRDNWEISDELWERIEPLIPPASKTVLHFPPATSKWNKIEHRLFSFISKN